jgi:hypothetical protein
MITILSDFGMTDWIPAYTPAQLSVTLSTNMCPTTDKEKAAMQRIPYRSLVSRCAHLSLCTRPDIAPFFENPGQRHWTAAKHLVRYLKHTIHLGITMGGTETPTLKGYADASFGTCPTTGRSITGHFFKWGGFISWNSKLQTQHAIALYSSGAEFYALSDDAIHNLWIRSILTDIGIDIQTPTQIFASTINFCNNNVRQNRTKHLMIREFSVHEQIKKFKSMTLTFIPG